MEMQFAAEKKLFPSQRVQLLIPFAVSVFFGFGLLFFPIQLALFFHYSGSDQIIYQIGGAAAIGYAFALWNIIKRASWKESKFVIMATFLYNLISVYACIIELLSHTQQPIVYVVLALSLFIMLICGKLIATHKLAPEGRRGMSDTSVIFLGLFMLATLSFGLLLLFPVIMAKVFQLMGIDYFIYRQTAAAVLGYSLLSIMQMRSRRFDESDLSLLMEITFIALTFAACVYQILSDMGSLFILILLILTILAEAGLLRVLFTGGKEYHR